MENMELNRKQLRSQRKKEKAKQKKFEEKRKKKEEEEAKRIEEEEKRKQEEEQRREAEEIRRLAERKRKEEEFESEEEEVVVVPPIVEEEERFDFPTIRDLINEFLECLADDSLFQCTVTYQISRYPRDYPEFNSLINLQLFLHIEIEEIRNFRKNPEFSPMCPPRTGVLIPRDYYIEMVFEMKLHKEFLQMIAATNSMDFSMNILNNARSLIVDAFKEGELSNEDSVQYLIVIANCTRGDSDDDPRRAQYFRILLRQLIFDYVGLNSKDSPEDPTTQEFNLFKMSVLLRLVGIVCMVEEDYTGHNEIAQICKEEKFDPIREEDLTNREIYRKGFDIPERDPYPLPIGLEVLNILYRILNQLTKQALMLVSYDVSECENIGMVAFITKMLVEKNSLVIKCYSEKCYTTLMKFTTEYSKFKKK